MSFGKFARPQLRPPEADATPVVYIIDNDLPVRESLVLLIRCAGVATDYIRVRSRIPFPATSMCTRGGGPRPGFRAPCQAAGLESLHRCFRSLTPREREVLSRVVSGLLNRHAAAHLGISETRFRSIGRT
jgi:FixJ family two-component response regulator